MKSNFLSKKWFVCAVLLFATVVLIDGCKKKPENPETTVSLTGMWYSNDQWFGTEHDRMAIDFVNSNTLIWYGTVSTNKNAFQDMEGISLEGCAGWYYFSKTYYTYVLTDNKIIFNDRIFTVFENYLVEDGSSLQWVPWDDGNDTPTTVTVITLNPTDITSTTATCGAEVTAGNGSNLKELGVCWGMSAYPTIDNSHLNTTSCGSPFVCTMSGLEPETKYHVRAYVLNGTNYVYGDDKTFITLAEGGGWGGGMPEGAINGKFTINANGDQVYFSKGNLQYIGSASTPYWKFADNQWDYFGTTTGQDSDSRYVDRDLFGWGTSGFNNKYPYLTSTTNSDYGEGQNSISGTRYDWGVYNPISNGGNVANLWRTLTRNEWIFLLETRYTISGIRYAKAQVNGVKGVVLVPDDWTTTIYALNNANGGNYSSNTITAADWTNTLEPKGAVFLPAAGWRNGTSILALENLGCYWSASNYSGYAYFVRLSYSSFDSGDGDRSGGHSVRLVCSTE